jgi:hypothetical protein
MPFLALWKEVYRVLKVRKCYKISQVIIQVIYTAVINLRGVSTNKTIICFIAMQTYKELLSQVVLSTRVTEIISIKVPVINNEKGAVGDKYQILDIL